MLAGAAKKRHLARIQQHQAAAQKKSQTLKDAQESAMLFLHNTFRNQDSSLKQRENAMLALNNVLIAQCKQLLSEFIKTKYPDFEFCIVNCAERENTLLVIGYQKSVQLNIEQLRPIAEVLQELNGKGLTLEHMKDTLAIEIDFPRVSILNIQRALTAKKS
jgi:hypothetical protein